MTREEAYKILNSLIKNQNLIKHHLACEAVMRNLAQKFQKNNEEIEKWGLVGLLHDADYEITKDLPKRHALVLEEKIKTLVDPEIMYAIKCHNWHNIGIEPKSMMDWSIYCCDELTGLIIAAVLIHPDKKLASLNKEFILNRFNEKSFARGANRDQIKMCQGKLGISLDEFLELALKAMQSISAELGL